MLYDDIANSPQNPFPGQIFNNPTPDGITLITRTILYNNPNNPNDLMVSHYTSNRPLYITYFNAPNNPDNPIST